MSKKTRNINLRQINGDVIVVPKSMNSDSLRDWYEDYEGRSAEEIEVVSLTDRRNPHDRRSPTFAEIVEKTEFETDDLPLFL